MFGNASENLRAAGDSADDGLPVTNVTLVTMLDAKPVQTVEAQAVAEAPSTRLADATAVETPVSETPAPTEEATEPPKPQAAEPDLSEIRSRRTCCLRRRSSLQTPPTRWKKRRCNSHRPSPRSNLPKSLKRSPPCRSPGLSRRQDRLRRRRPSRRRVTAAGPQKRAEKPSEKPAPAKSERSSGSRGNAALDARRGKADGQKNGSDGIASKGGASRRGQRGRLELPRQDRCQAASSASLSRPGAATGRARRNPGQLRRGRRRQCQFGSHGRQFRFGRARRSRAGCSAARCPLPAHSRDGRAIELELHRTARLQSHQVSQLPRPELRPV